MEVNKGKGAAVLNHLTVWDDREIENDLQKMRAKMNRRQLKMALIQMTYLSKALFRTVEVQVILPVDKVPMKSDADAASAQKFKTLYLLHGLLGSNIDWISGTCIQRWAEARNLAVVMPSGENSFYFDHPMANSAYGTFIGVELPEMMRKTFPLSDRREDTFIGGLSMGGYGAIRNGLKYCDTFSHIIALSSALHVFQSKGIAGELECFRQIMEAEKTDLNPEVAFEKAAEKGKVPKMFLTCGTEDTLLEVNRSFRDFLTDRGADITYSEEKGGHEWDFWNRQLHYALDWLPLDTELQGMNSGNVMVD